MRVIILGNGAWEKGQAWLPAPRRGDCVIACDGGYEKGIRAGMNARIIIGDMDSLRAKKFPRGVEVLRFPREKDETDGELALKLALGKKPDEIFWFAALGGRWDQTLANCGLLIQAARKKVPVTLFQGKWTIYLVLKRLALRGKIGETISLIPLSERVDGIFSRGLKYPLRGDLLQRHESRGVSNLLTSSKCGIEIRRGWLLVAHEKAMTRDIA